MNYSIENDFLKVEVAKKGAELQSIMFKKTGREHLWQGDEKYWSRRAPILFPIVGRLKNDTMQFEGRDYHMPQHGFARDLDFKLDHLSKTSISMSCTSTSQTLKQYPFEWELSCGFELNKNILSASARVTNLSEKGVMYFSLGFHPGFVLPFDETLTLEDYYILFNKDRTAKRWKIEGALIGEQDETDSIVDYKVQLSKDIFNVDALVFKGLKSDTLTILNLKTDSQIRFSFSGFPYLGIWSKPGAPYICLEPWHGIADSKYHNGDFIHKEGIVKLNGQKSFECGYSFEITM